MPGIPVNKNYQVIADGQDLCSSIYDKVDSDILYWCNGFDRLWNRSD
jgi:hypothetical protein